MTHEIDKPIEREALYDEVWADPMTIVAPRYGLSDVGLAKICHSLAIPIPSRGYWAKVRAGKVMARAPLPKLKNTNPIYTGLVRLPPEAVESREAAKKKATAIRRQLAEMEEVAPEPAAPDSNPELHPLVNAASKRLRKRDGWPKDTIVRAAPKEVLNVQVSRHALERSLELASKLLHALEAVGVRAVVDTTKGVTFLNVLSPPARIEFSITERIKSTPHALTRSEKQAQDRYYNRWRTGFDRDVECPSIPRLDYESTGKLTISAGHWPGRNWNDTAKTSLEQRLGTIVAEILVLGQDIHAGDVERARREDVYRRAKERYEFLTARRTNEIARFERLEKNVLNWDRATRLRTYADEVERRASENGNDSSEVREWLDWARAKADWLDPLIQMSDAILDAPEPKQPSYW